MVDTSDDDYTRVNRIWYSSRRNSDLVLSTALGGPRVAEEYTHLTTVEAEDVQGLACSNCKYVAWMDGPYLLPYF